MSKGIFRGIIRQVFIVRVFRNIVLAGEERPDAPDLQEAFPAVHHGQFVHRHQILSQFLKILSVGFLAAFGDAGVIHVDGLFSEQEFQLFSVVSSLPPRKREASQFPMMVSMLSL